MDPAASEERAQDANVLVALMPARNEVTQMHLAGAWSDTHAAQVSTAAGLAGRALRSRWEGGGTRVWMPVLGLGLIQGSGRGRALLTDREAGGFAS